jgi:hypothetical protein
MDARWIEPKARTSIGLSEVVEAEANESEQSDQLVETNKVNISTYSQASHRSVENWPISRFNFGGRIDWQSTQQ